jgi:hypothetical protein
MGSEKTHAPKAGVTVKVLNYPKKICNVVLALKRTLKSSGVFSSSPWLYNNENEIKFPTINNLDV